MAVWAHSNKDFCLIKKILILQVKALCQKPDIFPVISICCHFSVPSKVCKNDISGKLLHKISVIVWVTVQKLFIPLLLLLWVGCTSCLKMFDLAMRPLTHDRLNVPLDSGSDHVSRYDQRNIAIAMQAEVGMCLHRGVYLLVFCHRHEKNIPWVTAAPSSQAPEWKLTK